MLGSRSAGSPGCSSTTCACWGPTRRTGLRGRWGSGVITAGRRWRVFVRGCRNADPRCRLHARGGCVGVPAAGAWGVLANRLPAAGGGWGREGGCRGLAFGRGGDPGQGRGGDVAGDPAEPVGTGVPGG